MKDALRQLATNPRLTLVALVRLALGIGKNSTAFTVLHRLMLQSLPFHDPAVLVQVWATAAHGEKLGMLALLDTPSLRATWRRTE
jgi:hypothetical protein